MATISLLVCDDSAMARKQLLRALPAEWPVQISQATNGAEALERIRQGGIDLLLLDLTMPVLDGYGVLAGLRDEGLQCKVIVVSGDVQDEAVRRVTELGALAFLKKPAEPELVRETLQRLGLFDEAVTAAPRDPSELGEPSVNFRDAFREVINVAMGRAAALLARVLGVFVQLPLPNVNILEVGELHMALADAQSDQRLTAVCQGYIGGGISGEALLIFHDSEVGDMAKLLHRSAIESSSMEMLLDMSSVLIGACLSGIAEQINIKFSQGHPQILGQHAPIDELIRLNQQRWRKTLAVEFSYSIEGHDIHFDLMLLFTEDSVPLLTKKLAYMMG
ncbi:response regulator [Pseudomonas sp. SO81]|uniref:response regulator n=1 Tax=Pseudomonas sp. SO81 TaxID=2983246 RepID=UPI0025A4965A|nr:response regulator [Pseudomonas sp. SO81]WJN57743.1 Chemotaxis protein CheC -- inhibitor of MCP methylation [Pseudomonas sp. SO81]